MNGYEPDNHIRMIGKFTGEENGRGNYEVFEIGAVLRFSDGNSVISIEQIGEEFKWRNDDRTGIASSFMDAWREMPAYVTNPDHWEETEMIFFD